MEGFGAFERAEVGGFFLEEGHDGALGGILEAEEAVYRGEGVAGGHDAGCEDLPPAVSQGFYLKIGRNRPTPIAILIQMIATV